jgi:hypothetical protein
MDARMVLLGQDVTDLVGSGGIGIESYRMEVS